MAVANPYFSDNFGFFGLQIHLNRAPNKLGELDQSAKST